MGERNEVYGFERIGTSRGLVAEEPRGWCEAINERGVLLAEAAVSRWDFDIGWERRPVFQAEGRPMHRDTVVSSGTARLGDRE